MTGSAYSPGAACLRIHAQLLAARRTERLTQAALAMRLGVAYRTFQRWEACEAEPAASDLVRWAAVVGLAVTFGPIVEHVISDVSVNPIRSLHPARSAAAQCVQDAAGGRTFHGKSDGSVSHSAGGVQ